MERAFGPDGRTRPDRSLVNDVPAVICKHCKKAEIYPYKNVTITWWE